jgi:NTP pyrophosphatase (non-canonical NTP hydrolase)
MKVDQILLDNAALLQELAIRNMGKHFPTYNSEKLAEEAAELSLVLQQKKLKPTKVAQKEITDEIGDVLIRIRMYLLAHPEMQEEVAARVSKKLSSYHEWLSTGKYEKI